MHPRLATLVALADGELDPRQALGTQAHIAKCERCEAELSRIQTDKRQLSRTASSDPAVAEAVEQSFAGVMGAITAL
jgi:anti-sigma factor RsiW